MKIKKETKAPSLPPIGTVITTLAPKKLSARMIFLLNKVKGRKSESNRCQKTNAYSTLLGNRWNKS